MTIEESQLYEQLFLLNWRLRDEILYRRKKDRETRDDFIKTLDDRVIDKVEKCVSDIRYLLFNDIDT